MTKTEIEFNGTTYVCRVVESNEGEELIIAGYKLRDALMPYEMTDGKSGFANLKAEHIDGDIFFYVQDSDLKLSDKELIEVLKEDNPDWFD